jgi:hypothetical protein
MKTILLFLLLISAAHADQWLVNGLTYKGTIHKLSADNTKIYVTSDWDNYGGSWLKVAELDAPTRVRLGVATPQEEASVRAAQELAAAEAKARAAEMALYQARESARAAEQTAARREAETAQYQRQMIALREREVRALDRVSRWHIYLPFQQNGVVVPNVPRVPQIPQIPQVPQVQYGVPIRLWNN